MHSANLTRTATQTPDREYKKQIRTLAKPVFGFSMKGLIPALLLAVMVSFPNDAISQVPDPMNSVPADWPTTDAFKDNKKRYGFTCKSAGKAVRQKSGILASCIKKPLVRTLKHQRG